jgi:hypothetical protein
MDLVNPIDNLIEVRLCIPTQVEEGSRMVTKFRDSILKQNFYAQNLPKFLRNFAKQNF